MRNNDVNHLKEKTNPVISQSLTIGYTFLTEGFPAGDKNMGVGLHLHHWVGLFKI